MVRLPIVKLVLLWLSFASATMLAAQEAKPAAPAAKEVKPEAKPDTKPAAKPENKPENKPETKPAEKAEAKTFKSDIPIVIEADKSTATTGPAIKKLIFIDFYNESNNPNAKWLVDSIGESIFELTKNKYNYTRIPNKVWREYATQKNFKPEDFYNTEKLQAMGYALKVDGIIFGKFITTEENIQISGKILSVVDKEIIAEKNVTVPFSSQMFEDVQDVSETLGSRIKDLFFPSDRGALWRSAVLPGWGQYYKQRKTWGYIYGGVIGAGATFSLFSFIMLQSSKRAYENYKPDHVETPQGEYGIKDPAAAQAQFETLQKTADQWYQITVISASITLTIYLWHLFDAWFFEGSYTEIAKGSAMNGLPGDSLFGANIRITSDRDPMSIRIGFAF
jgi:TolB-like protein